MQGGGTMYKILCIDDNSMFSDELSAYLALENTSIDCYSDINSCINYIESGFYSLLIICIDKIIECHLSYPPILFQYYLLYR